MQFVKPLVAGLCILMISGCAILNPYESKSMCPTKDNFGKCVSMMDAYKSVEEDQNEKGNVDQNKTVGNVKPNQKDIQSSNTKMKGELSYRSALYKEISDLLREPKTPMVRPPTVRRVLILPYEDGALYMPRFIYVMIDKASWILTDALSEGRNSKEMELFDDTDK